MRRFEDVYGALDVPANNVGNVDVLNLRGHGMPLDRLVPVILSACEGTEYAMVIIDPIYKVITGDENSATDMAYFTAQLDVMADRSNIIIPEDGSALVIVDWAHAAQGNGAADCAITYLHLVLNGEKDFAEKYLRRYCERQGCTMAYVQSWMSIVEAAELERGRVHERDFLMSWIDVVDWV